MKYILEVVLIILLLLFAALTAASETSIIAVSRLKLRRLASAGSKSAKIVLKMLETPERFFGTILVSNNVANTLMASLLTAVIIYIVGEMNKGVLLATVIAAGLTIVSEVSAKTLAAKHSEKLALLLAVPVKMLIIIFSPIVKILSAITNAIVTLIGGKTEGVGSVMTPEEIKALIKIGEEEDSLHREKYRMLSRVFEFGETVVKNVMTPKKEIVSIDIQAKLDDIMETVLESGYSRFPVYRDNPDNIVGTMNMKDLLSLSCNRNLIVLADIVYPATLVPGSKKVTDLLKEFQKGHTHMAIVTSPQGRIEGLVTLEDLLEEIVGEIEDEYDVRSKSLNKDGAS